MSLNTSPFGFTQYELQGMMTLDWRDSLSKPEPALHHRMIYPNILASPSEMQTQLSTECPRAKWAQKLDDYLQTKDPKTLNKLCLDLYSTSLNKYTACEPFFETLNHQEKLLPTSQLIANKIIEEAISKPLKEVYSIIGNSFTNYVQTKWNLNAYLNIWQGVYLMQDGHSMSGFLEDIFQKLEDFSYYGNKLKFIEPQWDLFDNLFDLNFTLREYVGTKRKDIANNFGFVECNLKGKKVKTIGTDVKYFERVALTYSAEFPLSIMMCSEIETRYNLIFQWLLKIKRANFALRNITEWNRHSSPLKDTKLIHQFQLFEREVGHFTRTLESFVFSRSIVPNLEQLKKEVSEARDFDSLVHSHLRILQKMVESSLCTNKMLSVPLTQILGIALRIRKRVVQIVSQELDVESISAKLFKYRSKFEQSQHFILQTLSKATKKSKSFSNLQDVLIGINFNDFYHLLGKFNQRKNQYY